MLRFLAIFIFSTTVSLAASELSYYFTLSGKLYTTPAHTTPMTEQNIPIRLQILNSSKTCILYDETQLVSTDTTDGAFSIQVGSDVGDPKRVVASDPGNAMTTVFQNTSAIPATCAGNSAAAVAKSGRYLRITVTHPITSVQDTLSPDVFLGSMPTSLVAETLGGLTKDQFLQLGAGSLTQANVESVFSAANYPVLAGLIGGTAPSAGFNNNTNYIITADADSNGSGAIQFAIGASTKAQITNSGDFVANQRIGVGTAAPTYDISLSGEAARTVGMERDQNVGDPGKSLTLLAGAAGANGTDQNGGTLYLSSGMSTGSGGSSIGFMTATPGATGTTDRSATLKMILDPLGYLGLGNAAPDRILHITSSSAPTVLLENSASAANARRRYLTTTTTGDLAFGKFSDDMSTTTEHMRILSSGNTGLGVINPTATLQLKAGTAAAGTAPLKLTSGVNLTTPEDGAIEYDGTNLFYTDSTNTRKTISTSGGSIATAAGTAAAPSLSFSGDPDTGLYSSAANTIGVSAGGSQIFTMSSSGLVSSTAGGGSVSTTAGSAAAPTFSFAGDTDTGWYAPLANTLAASTGGSERIRIDSSGNVGIGTTAPGSALEVQTGQTSVLTGTDAVYGSLFYTTVAPTANEAFQAWPGSQHNGTSFTTEIPSTSANNVQAIIGANTTAINSGTGNVNYIQGSRSGGYNWINTTVSNISGSSIWAETDTGTVGTLKALDLWSGVLGGTVTSQYSIYSKMDRWGGTVTNRYGLYLEASGAATNDYGIYQQTSQKNYLNGYVGIGNTNPTGLIDMSFNDTAPAGGLFRVMDSGAASGYIKFDDGTTSAGQFHPKLEVKGTGSTRPFTIEMNSSAAHDSGTMPMMVFNTSAAGTVANRPLFDFQNNGSSKMTMLASGYVGIGTTAPSTELEVSGLIQSTGTSGAVHNGIKIKNSSTSTSGPEAGLLLQTGNTDKASVIGGVDGAATAGYLALRTRQAGTLTEVIRLNSSGNVGIGLTAPTTKLQVAGDISPSVTNNYSLGTASLLFTAVYATNGTIQTSDAKKKRDIASSDLGLDFINRLRPVSYRWLAGPDDDLHYGLIAQETEKAIKEVKVAQGETIDPDEQIIVSHDKKTESYGLKYNELISPIIKAVQELYRKVMTVSFEQSRFSKELKNIQDENKKLRIQNELQAKQIDAMRRYLCSRDKEAEICK